MVDQDPQHARTEPAIRARPQKGSVAKSMLSVTPHRQPANRAERRAAARAARTSR